MMNLIRVDYIDRLQNQVMLKDTDKRNDRHGFNTRLLGTNMNEFTTFSEPANTVQIHPLNSYSGYIGSFKEQLKSKFNRTFKTYLHVKRLFLPDLSYFWVS